MWSPYVIKKVESNTIGTSTKPIIVDTNAGKGYFKALGNPSGPHALACEWVGTSLAQLLEIATFNFSILDYNGIPEIQFDNGEKAHKGAGFFTKTENGNIWDGTEESLKTIANEEDITKLVILDTWLRNKDRYFESPEGIIRRSDNVFLGERNKKRIFIAFDFTHAFCNGRDVNVKISNISSVKDELIYGFFPEFKQFIKAEIAEKTCKKINDLSKQKKDIQNILEVIPKEWDVRTDVREKWAEFIFQRAAYLSQHFLELTGLVKNHNRNLFDHSEE